MIRGNMKVVTLDSDHKATAAPSAPEQTAGASSAKAPLRLPTRYGAISGRAAKNPRAAHRQAQRDRVDGSSRLAATYPQLKSLSVKLEFAQREGNAKTTGMKYSVNLEHAKSVLLFACPSAECTGGDFDLTAELAAAIAARHRELKGEVRCLGNHKMPLGGMAPCRSVLHYTLNMAYARAR